MNNLHSRLNRIKKELFADAVESSSCAENYNAQASEALSYARHAYGGPIDNLITALSYSLTPHVKKIIDNITEKLEQETPFIGAPAPKQFEKTFFRFYQDNPDLTHKAEIEKYHNRFKELVTPLLPEIIMLVTSPSSNTNHRPRGKTRQP